MSSPDNTRWAKCLLGKNVRVIYFIIGVIILVIQLWRLGLVDNIKITEWISLNGPTVIAIVVIIIALSPTFYFHFKSVASICKSHINMKSPVIISFIVLIFFLLHLLWPERFGLDAVILGLLVIMIIPWLPPLIRSLELPGGLKIQFSEAIQNVARDATEAGLIPSPNPNEVASTSGSNEASNKSLFQRIANEDPAIALAGLRIEIERRLVRIAQLNEIDASKTGIGRLLPTLHERNILTNQETQSLRELIRILNSAAHGADIRKEDALDAIDVGISILGSLENKIANLDAHS